MKMWYLILIYSCFIGCSTYLPEKNAESIINNVQKEQVIVESDDWQKILEETDKQDAIFKEPQKIKEWIQRYRQEILWNGGNADLLFLYGRMLGFLHRPEDSVLFFYRALDFDKNSIWAYYGLGMYYLQKQAHFQATTYFNKCEELHKNFAPLYEARAKMTQNNLAQAIFNMKKACNILPTRASYWHNLGNLYLQAKEKEKGEESLCQAMQLQPHNISRLKDLALFYLVEKQNTKALLILEKILNICPQEQKKQWENLMDSL
jgi:tetratricopeptide (TPR) repeat protein